MTILRTQNSAVLSVFCQASAYFSALSGDNAYFMKIRRSVFPRLRTAFTVPCSHIEKPVMNEDVGKVTLVVQVSAVVARVSEAIGMNLIPACSVIGP